jgi:hypothetical protein
MDAATLIAAATCPVCKAPRRALINPRRALQEHIRASKDPAHAMWRRQHYDTFFKRGGDMKTAAVSEEAVIGAVRAAFGDQWAGRLHFTGPSAPDPPSSPRRTAQTA